MSQTRVHEYGLDVARIFAMFLVCAVHAAGCWHGVSHAPAGVDYGVALVFCAISFVGVNLFMLITGYLGINRQWRVGGYLRLWAQVAFYMVGGFLVAYLWDGQFLGKQVLLNCFFPIPFANGYWYFTAYSAAFFLFPYINKGFLALTKAEREKLLLVLFAATCLFGCFNRSIADGYNAVWMLEMYLAGAYMKLHPPVVSARRALAVFLLCCLLSALFAALREYGRRMYGLVLPFAVFSFTAPLTLLASLAVFHACAKMQVRASWLRCALAALAPLTFAVYLIHVHPALCVYFAHFADWMGGVSHYAWWYIPAVAVPVFVFCIAVDALRRWGVAGLAACLRAVKQKKGAE